MVNERIDGIRVQPQSREKTDSIQSERAKSDVVQLIELKTNTLQALYDQIRSDYYTFKEEAEHKLKNTVSDVSKIHKNMAKFDSISKENKLSIDTLQQLVLMPG